ncbi:MAG: ATP synthase F1 subunit delta [Ignavibacteriales bacterium]|jgi:F-type H+-transporting ATPase subunit delta|nr:ATP synthase F1 subunit delta [Ignavibacteriaceae bacterium]NLH61897.1 ATP synthase F1 subunit delta [Ignavibacteriales bacterium]HOJ17900.1 ATP synthase F1 subunit delta [Ignavibacteriaceae bacterium]HPO56332.1 ATP synthase F1 subunit delta [Ignavibacteriaceae bacterium]
MSLLKLKRNYANSFLDTCYETASTEKVAEEVSFFIEILDENLQLKRMLKNPVIKPNKKLLILNEIFEKRISKGFEDFLKLIIMNNRADLLEDVLKLYIKLKDEREGIAEVRLTVNHLPDKIEEEKIRVKIADYLGKKVVLNIEQNSEILGGFVAMIDDKVIDGSLRHQLDKIKKTMLKASI